MEKFIRKIVVTGPESTGKTELTDYIAGILNCDKVPEFARTYIEKLNSPYAYSDLENITKKQIEEYYYYSARNTMIIFDTWLIITKIWFLKVFDKYPSWLEENLKNLKIDLYLLCAPDIEWIPDPVRENGGTKRVELFGIYEDEIKKTGVSYGIVRGKGKERYRSAEKILRSYL